MKTAALILSCIISLTFANSLLYAESSHGTLEDRLFDPDVAEISEAFIKEINALPKAVMTSMYSYPVKIKSDGTAVAVRDYRGEIRKRAKKELGSKDSCRRRKAAALLNFFKDDSGAPVMISDMSSSDPNDRLGAAKVLSKTKSSDKKVYKTFLKGVDDDMPEIRLISVKALGGIGESGAIPRLIKALGEDSLTKAAAESLTKIKNRRFGKYAWESNFGRDPELWQNWWEWKNIDSKVAVGRVHRKWKTEPDVYEKVKINIKHRSFMFDSIKDAKGAMVVILPEDQTDEFIKKCIKGRIFAGKADSGGYGIPRWDYKVKPLKKWIVCDAMGDVIKGATVEMFLRNYKGPCVKVNEVVSDGVLSIPDPIGGIDRWEFVISHPDYGIAKSAHPIATDKLLFPVVHRKSIAASRAVSGRVIDDEGNPVSHATVECLSGITNGMSGFNSGNERSAVITDAEGKFRIYIPINKRLAKRQGKIIPVNTKYRLRIEAYEGSDLPPHKCEVVNGREKTIILGPEGNRHTFEFHDDVSIIEGKSKLQYVSLTIKRGENLLRLSYSEWSKMKKFPNGTYTANIFICWKDSNHVGSVNSEPVEVTDESAKKIVMRLPESVTYTGRVVNGITGEPFAGAYVFALNAICQGKSADISAEQWEAIDKLGDDISINDKAIAPIKAAFSFGQICRTDYEGYYTLKTTPGKKYYSFMALAENHLLANHREYPSKSVELNQAEVKTLKMYPAGRVLIQPIADKDISVHPKIQVDWSSVDPWAKDMRKDRRKVLRDVEYFGSFRANSPHHITVPADTPFRIKLRTSYNEEWAPYITDEIYVVRQGEVLDLGKVMMPLSLKVYVKAVDSEGKAAAGIPIRRVIDNFGSIAKTTDKSGKVLFYVPANSRGYFYARDERSRDHGGTGLKDKVDFDIGGKDDEGAEYVLRLSDELLSVLSGEI